MTLFQKGNFVLHSGMVSSFLIDCMALTQKDWDAIAALVAPHLQYGRVVGVPRGGLPFASALESYIDRESPYTLIVDDVLTTGRSMDEVRQGIHGPTRGLVLFARGACSPWIECVFQMTSRW